MEQKPNSKVDAQKTHQSHNNNNNNNKQTLSQNQIPSHISPKQDLHQQQQKLPTTTTTTTTTNLTKPNNNSTLKSKKPIWDCGSTLYDSFELSSFQKQLDSAIINSSRTYSMPRLPSENRRAPPPQQQQQPPSKRPIASKVSRSFQKLLRSVFRAHKPNSNNHSKPNNYDSSLSSSPDPWFMDPHQVHEDEQMVVDGGRYFVVYDKPNGLSSIPEAPEVGFSPDINSLVRKTMSARFTPTSRGIYCS